MALVDKKIKDFDVTAFKAGEEDFFQVKRDDIKGKWSVFFFYPADFTFVCPTELGDLADNYDHFQKLGVDIYAVSTDSHWTHKAFHNSSDVVGKVKYAMLADDQFKLSKQFKVLRSGEGRSDRGTFIVDPNCVIQAYEITAEGIGRDASDLLRKVKAAQYVHNNPDEVCPAKWQEGEETLTPSLDLSGKI
jgi:peroxiredoxin (alkyl hydroperoxide reductase subunit C)